MISELDLDLPEDFDLFWKTTAEEAFAVPIRFKRSLKPVNSTSTHIIETLSFTSIEGRELHGWIAYPSGARRVPGFLWIPPYGRESKLPDQYGTREGFVSMSFNLHGLEAFHQESYVPVRGYFGEGIGSPETWIFRRIVQDCIVASRVMQSQLEVDEDSIAAMGMSQGGGLSIWMSAWNPVIKAICADMPFMGDIQNTLSKTVYRYPLKEVADAIQELPLGEARVMNTVSYFDTRFHASRCVVPAHLSLGLKDPACRPETVRQIFDSLAGPKKLEVYDWGHDWHPSMVANNRDWLVKYL